MRLSLLCLAGDGIGPEITQATRAVVAAAAQHGGLKLDWRAMDIGFVAHEATGSTIPQPVIDAAKHVDGVILGPVSHNAYPPLAAGGLNPSGVLRKELDLFANIRPARSYTGVATPLQGPIDLVIYRENLEGFYADRNMMSGSAEMMPVPGVALAFRKITAFNSERIARAAFRGAMQRPAKRVTAVHKANVMRLSDGLFLDTVRTVAKEFPEVAYNEVLVDAAAALLVRDPRQFDVIVTTNMFGDILSDLASELSGGLGLAASLNLGPEFALAQAQHGSAPDLAGKDLANPVSLIASAALLLAHLGAEDAAHCLDAALVTALQQPNWRTVDLRGSLGTQAFAARLIEIIKGI